MNKTKNKLNKSEEQDIEKSDFQKLDNQKPSKTKTDLKPVPKFGILGKDLGSKFFKRKDTAWRPTKPGGRNGQGKP